MAAQKRNLRQELILAGIDEINIYGANGFSVRRVAESCHVSSAAPYKHFKDKKEFISAIIDYVNEQWAVVQDEVLAACGEDPRSQMVEVAVSYVRFLMEKPYYRQILMLKNGQLIDSGTPGRLLEDMQGKVFNLPVAYTDVAMWQGKALIRNVQRREKDVLLRIVSDDCPGGEPAVPDLEDVYLYHFQEASGEG